MAKDEILDWLHEVSEVLVHSTIQIILGVDKPVNDVGLEDKLAYMFMQTFVHALVAQALSDYRKHDLKEGQEQFDHVSEKFHTVKTELSNAISMGFESAWYQVFARDIDYYTSIDPVALPINKQPC